MLEVMTKNDIGETSKPIFIFNSSNIYDNLINLFNDLKFNGLITRDFNKIKVTISSNPIELADIINNYCF
jgi:predicted Rossmann-fold nucleotide-binding protein